MVVFIGLLPAQATTSTLQSLQAPIRLKLLCRSESCSPETPRRHPQVMQRGPTPNPKTKKSQTLKP